MQANTAPFMRRLWEWEDSKDQYYSNRCMVVGLCRLLISLSLSLSLYIYIYICNR